MRDKLVIIIFIYLISSSSVYADLSLLSTSRADALGGTVLLSAPTASEQLISGGQKKSTEKISFEFGYKRQYDLKELDLLSSSISYRMRHLNFLAGFTQLGDPNLYTQKKMRIGFLYTKPIYTIGAFVTRESHDFANHYQSVSLIDYGMSLQYFHQIFIVNAVLDKINQSSLLETSIKPSRKLTLYAELLGNDYYKTTIKFSTQKGYANRFGIGESIKISRVGTLLFGFSTAPIEFGGGVEIMWNNTNLIYNASYHPVLGLTHTMSFVVGLLDN